MYVPKLVEEVETDYDVDLDPERVEAAFLDAHQTTLDNITSPYYLDEYGYNLGEAHLDDVIQDAERFWLGEKEQLTALKEYLAGASDLSPDAPDEIQELASQVESKVIDYLNRKFCSIFLSLLEDLAQTTIEESNKILYDVEFIEDEDGHVIDYNVIESEGGPFASEEEAADWARSQFELKKCPQCGLYHPLHLPNPCICNICGMPMSDGHWHPLGG